MIYMENILICIVSPLLIAFFLVRGETRRFIGFYILGLVACLFSAHIDSFLVAAFTGNIYAGMTETQALIQITPICEEVMKALPVFLFVAIMLPEPGNIVAASFATGLGFATFENICYILQHGADDFFFILVRGFSAGVTHAVCAAILGYGLAMVYRRGRLAFPGSFALLCVASTYHGIYNLLVVEEGVLRTAGYIMPIITAAAILCAIIWRGGALTENHRADA